MRRLSGPALGRTASSKRAGTVVTSKRCGWSARLAYWRYPLLPLVVRPISRKHPAPGAKDIRDSLIGIDCARRPWNAGGSVDFMPRPAKEHPDPELKAPLGVRVVGDDLTDLGMASERIALSATLIDHYVVDVLNTGSLKCLDDRLHGEIGRVAAVVGQLTADSAFDG